MHSSWQYRLWNFQAGGTKLERFLPKNQFQRKLLDFENWINGEVSKIRQIIRSKKIAPNRPPTFFLRIGPAAQTVHTEIP